MSRIGERHRCTSICRAFSTNQVVKDFENIFPQVQKAKGLILDIRHNHGGNSGNGNAIISMLIDKPINDLRWKTRQYMPAFRAWGQKEHMA